MKLHNCTYRNNDIICTIANSLYPERASTNFVRKAEDGSDGVMIIDKSRCRESIC